VWRGLEASVFIRTLKRFEGQLVYRPLPLGEAIPLENAAGKDLGLVARAIPAPGKLPVHLMEGGDGSPADNVAVALGSGTGPTILYAAACATASGVDLSGHAAVLFDGTFFREDELVRQGLSKAVAKDMAHVPIVESMAQLAKLGGRKIFTHINNTNPILVPGTEEHRTVVDAGFEIAFDGMEIVP
jgi:pyrroloquinoline quinone biosynthesis protein B